jgi:Uma2 family endonuclease
MTMSVVAASPMTVEEFLALPPNSEADRVLFRGELREKPMTLRNRTHSRIVARVTCQLVNWLDLQPAPRGEIIAGEGGCIIRNDPDTAVGIDVAYVSAETIAQQTGRSTMVEGSPVLAVEVLSPSDRQSDVDDMVDEYLECGVAIVWIINPRFRHVTVYRRDRSPVLFAETEQLDAEPELPGFSVPVEVLFR